MEDAGQFFEVNDLVFFAVRADKANLISRFIQEPKLRIQAFEMPRAEFDESGFGGCFYGFAPGFIKKIRKIIFRCSIGT